jgi:hypothetical protein
MERVSDRLRQFVGSDEALLLDVDARLEGALGSWIRLGPDAATAPEGRLAQARIYVHQAPLSGAEVPRVEPALRVGSVGVWPQESGRAVLGSGEGDCAGAVDLDALQATIVSGAQGLPQRLRTMLGMAVGLLLGRLGRALVCGAVVAPPGGGAWLVVGEEGAGKTGTLVRLAAAGWGYLAVEQAVLRRAASGALSVEGWPGPAAAEEELVGARRRGAADLTGVLMVRQAPREETALSPRRDLDVLGALLPTSPWLHLDQQGAAGVLRALRQGARVPTYDLRLGLDSYAEPGRLAEVLEELPGA